MTRPPRIECNLNPAGRDFVAGDIHGESATLERLLDQVDFRPGTDRLFALGDLVDRGPDSLAAIEWLESKRITLSIRGNHEQMLLERIEARQENPQAYGLTMHPWFLDGVEHADWPRWTAMIRSMPIAATIHTRTGRVGLVHAAPTARHWDTTIDKLAAGDSDTLWTALDNSALTRRDRLSADLAQHAGVPIDGNVHGVRAVLTGHTILPAVTRTGCVWHLDTGAGTRNGRLTLAQIDVDPIETLTIDCAIDTVTGA